MKRGMVFGVCLLAVSACGGDDDTSDTTAAAATTAAATTAVAAAEPTTATTAEAATPTTTTTVANVDDAVRAYAAAWGDGDADLAWSMVSATCKVKIDENEYRAGVKSAGEDYPDIEAVDVHSSVNGDDALVDYEAKTLTSYDGQRWTLEDGAWHWDAC